MGGSSERVPLVKIGKTPRNSVQDSVIYIIFHGFLITLPFRDLVVIF